MEITVNDVKLTDEVEGWTGANEYGESGRSMTIADLVAERLADRLVAENTGYYNTLHQRVDRRINELISDRVAPMIDEAMTKPIRKTNAYGEPISGTETTMRELIVDAARKWFEQPDSTDGYGGRKGTKAQRLIAEAVGATLSKELSEVIKAEREKVVAAVRAQAADIIARSVAAGVGGK